MIVKHVLLWLFSLLLVLNVSSVALANSTSSQVGIYFTDQVEKEPEELKDKPDSSSSFDQKSNGTSSKLPQAGNQQGRGFFNGILLLLLGVIVLVISRYKKLEKRGKKNEIENDDNNWINV